MCHNGQHDHYGESECNTSVYTGRTSLRGCQSQCFTHHFKQWYYRYLESGFE